MDQYARLLADLSEAGELGAEWRGAFERAPRSAFVPDTIWLPDDTERRGYRQVVRAVDAAAWTDAVNADDVVVTQLDDGNGDGPGISTSSASMPSLVAGMLRHLDVAEGHRVLDVGTGTGWTAALLSARIGGKQVSTVEVDADVAAAAEVRLNARGFFPRCVTGDGAKGHVGGAPFDRVHSTAAVQRVPGAWVAQTRPGGVIVTPWGTPYCNAGLVKLTVDADGGLGQGRFVGNVSFMWLRDQRPAAEPEAPEPVRVSASAMDPELALEDVDSAFAIGLRVPGARYSHRWVEPDRPATYRMVLHDPEGSWASVRYRDWGRAGAVRQSGPRSLWDEVVQARGWWEGQGRPELTRFGVTVTAEGQQRVWLDNPGKSVANSQEGEGS